MEDLMREISVEDKVDHPQITANHQSLQQILAMFDQAGYDAKDSDAGM